MLFMVPLHQILFGPNVPAGIDWAILGLWTCQFRKTAQPCEPPILVAAEGDYWRLKDGRHRVIAAIMAGRTAIEAELDVG